jgi:hypothetical protein
VSTCKHIHRSQNVHVVGKETDLSDEWVFVMNIIKYSLKGIYGTRATPECSLIRISYSTLYSDLIGQGAILIHVCRSDPSISGTAGHLYTIN